MKNLYILLLLSFCLISPFTLSAQKSYKAVCDKSDGKVKIVESAERSPDLIPLKGGFPFYQVAENWVKENYPDGKCDPARAVSRNQASADAMGQAATPARNQPAKQDTGPDTFFGAQAVPAPAAVPSFRYRNTSMFISFLFSDLGKVYHTDPPLIPGIGIGIDQVFGTRFYGGTGLHLNTLIGKTDDGAGVSSFYSIRIPLLAGYRQVTGQRYWGVEMGIAANTSLRPLASDSDMGGETAAGYSVNAMTRVRMGKENSSFGFGVDVWLNELLTSEEGFRMTVLSVGYRYSF
jgi:hypothetical protein